MTKPKLPPRLSHPILQLSLEGCWDHHKRLLQEADKRERAKIQRINLTYKRTSTQLTLWHGKNYFKKMSAYDELHYPNLTNCRMKIVGSGGSAENPPIHLPSNCLNAAKMTIMEKPYDFDLERTVLKRKQAREHDMMLAKATSKEELQKATLTKMKSVTGAEDNVCVAMLESKGYDLKTSIEAFFLENS